jgi:hypothetical protein
MPRLLRSPELLLAVLRRHPLAFAKALDFSQHDGCFVQLDEVAIPIDLELAPDVHRVAVAEGIAQHFSQRLRS